MAINEITVKINIRKKLMFNICFVASKSLVILSAIFGKKASNYIAEKLSVIMAKHLFHYEIMK